MDPLEELVRDLCAVIDPALDAGWVHLIQTNIDDGEDGHALAILLQGAAEAHVDVPAELLAVTRQVAGSKLLTGEENTRVLKALGAVVTAAA